MSYSILIPLSNTETQEDVSETAPGVSPPALVRGLAGFAFLGLAGAMGGDETLRAAPSALTTGVGMLLMTVPALLVGHQLAGLQSAPEALVAALARVFSRCGDIALAAVGVVTLFSATSGLGPAVFSIVATGIAGLGFALVTRTLARMESNTFSMLALTLGWALLAALIGARIFISFLI